MQNLRREFLLNNAAESEEQRGEDELCCGECVESSARW